MTIKSPYYYVTKSSNIFQCGSSIVLLSQESIVVKGTSVLIKIRIQEPTVIIIRRALTLLTHHSHHVKGKDLTSAPPPPSKIRKTLQRRLVALSHLPQQFTPSALLPDTSEYLLPSHFYRLLLAQPSATYLLLISSTFYVVKALSVSLR